LLPDGKRKDLILIKDWDFNWQGDYRYASPISLPRGTTLVMRWTYDNSEANPRNPNHPPKLVRYGPQTTDEMGELWFQVLPRNSAEGNLFDRDFYAHLGRLVIAYNESRLAEDPNNAEAHTRAGRARFYFGQVTQAVDHFQAAIQSNPNYDKAYYELGSIYLRQNRLAEARQAFETVVRLNPDDYEAEGSLGFIFLRTGELDEAEAHFRAALRINPSDRIASKNLDQVLQARSALKNQR
jgi:tetratricopeptide (TPR) repeat protein